MRSFDESNADDVSESVKQHIRPWMLRAIQMNPGYCSWGPYEDYMYGDDKGWAGRQIIESWDDFGPWALDDLNECVNFYFYAQRDSEQCVACDGSGLNPATKRIADSFYRHSCPAGMDVWNDTITQDEVQALVDSGRLMDFTHDFTPGEGWKRNEARPVPTAAQVNSWQRGTGLGHDAINRWILVETRAKRLGAWGKCAKCDGEGSIFTTEEARLGLVLWMIHPRKGASRGVDVKNIAHHQTDAVFAWLRQAAERNAARFAKVGQQHVNGTVLAP